MEKEFKLKIPGTKKKIYGKLLGSLKKPVVVLVHALAGSLDDRLIYNGGRYLHAKGFSVLRLNLYSWQKDARAMMECTLKTHASDLNVVLKHLRQYGCKWIFVAGHSYAGPAIMLANSAYYDGASLWDPSYKSDFRQYGKYIRSLRAYRMRWGIDFLASKRMNDYSRFKVPWDKLAARVRAPLQIVAAGKSQLLKSCHKYFQQANEQKSLVVVKGAPHNFEEYGQAEQVFQATAAWFRRCLRCKVRQ